MKQEKRGRGVVGPEPSAARDRLPVAVIGAGPVGLVAAAHLIERGETPLVLEAGDAVGASVREWAHVRLFSPWKYLTDPVSRGLLEADGWEHPDPERLPTGGELVERFIEPLAKHSEIEPRIRLNHRVVAVTRRGMDTMKTPARDETPFELTVETAAGEVRIPARAVVDASGTWTTPNPLGSNGLPVPGEGENGGRVRYGIPDVFGRERRRYAGRRTLVVGGGHSAFNTLLDLVRLQDAEGSAGEIVWAIRRRDLRQLYGGGEDDELAARGALGRRLREAVEAGRIQRVAGFRTARIDEDPAGLVVRAEDGRAIGPVDEIVATTGYRPDLSLTRELRLELDPATESPVDLAPLIDPNVHSCGTVYPHGFEELSHPEKDFYTVGMKSYGRAPTFLLLTGYEQVRSVVAALAGDLDAARRVDLALPETGVCRTDLDDAGCEAEAPALAGPESGIETQAGSSCGTVSACAVPAPDPSADSCCG